MSVSIIQSIATATRSRSTPDWDIILQICDLINNNPSLLTYAVSEQLIFQLKDENPTVVYLTLMLIDTIVKNCGDKAHRIFNNQAFMHRMKQLIYKRWMARKHGFGRLEQTKNLIGDKAVRMIQHWGVAFHDRRSTVPYYYETYRRLISKGVRFPPATEETRTPIDTPVKRGDMAQKLKKSQQNTKVPESITKVLTEAQESTNLIYDLLVNPQNQNDVVTEVCDQLKKTLKKLEATISENPAPDTILSKVLDVVDKASDALKRAGHPVESNEDSDSDDDGSDDDSKHSASFDDAEFAQTYILNIKEGSHDPFAARRASQRLSMSPVAAQPAQSHSRVTLSAAPPPQSQPRVSLSPASPVVAANPFDSLARPSQPSLQPSTSFNLLQPSSPVAAQPSMPANYRHSMPAPGSWESFANAPSPFQTSAQPMPFQSPQQPTSPFQQQPLSPNWASNPAVAGNASSPLLASASQPNLRAQPQPFQSPPPANNSAASVASTFGKYWTTNDAVPVSPTQQSQPQLQASFQQPQHQLPQATQPFVNGFQPQSPQAPFAQPLAPAASPLVSSVSSPNLSTGSNSTLSPQVSSASSSSGLTVQQQQQKLLAEYRRENPTSNSSFSLSSPAPQQQTQPATITAAVNNPFAQAGGSIGWGLNNASAPPANDWAYQQQLQQQQQRLLWERQQAYLSSLPPEQRQAAMLQLQQQQLQMQRPW